MATCDRMHGVVGMRLIFQTTLWNFMKSYYKIVIIQYHLKLSKHFIYFKQKIIRIIMKQLHPNKIIFDVLFYMLKSILLQILLFNRWKNREINFLYFWLINEFRWIINQSILWYIVL